MRCAQGRGALAHEGIRSVGRHLSCGPAAAASLHSRSPLIEPVRDREVPVTF